MPPSDPRLCPALAPCAPGDIDPDAPSWITAQWDGREVLFGDGEWHHCHIRMWTKDRRGRDVIQVEFTASGATYTASYVADPSKIRLAEY